MKTYQRGDWTLNFGIEKYRVYMSSLLLEVTSQQIHLGIPCLLRVTLDFARERVALAVHLPFQHHLFAEVFSTDYLPF